MYHNNVVKASGVAELYGLFMLYTDEFQSSIDGGA